MCEVGKPGGLRPTRHTLIGGGLSSFDKPVLQSATLLTDSMFSREPYPWERVTGTPQRSSSHWRLGCPLPQHGSVYQLEANVITVQLSDQLRMAQVS